MSRNHRQQQIGLGLLALAMLVAPFIYSGDYRHSVLIHFCINLLLLTGLNIVSGFGGQISLAHAGLYGVGAYTAGILTATYDWPPIVALVLAPVVAGLIALIVGAASLRLHGLYFAMATLGTGVVLFLLFERAVSITGGPNGLVGVPAFSVLGFTFNSLQSLYWLSAVPAFIGVWASVNLVNSRIGRGLQALGISELGAKVVGVDTFRLKLLVFVLSGLYAGMAGALMTFQTRFVSPQTFGFLETVILFVVLVLAGRGTLWGPLVGSFMLTVLDELLARAPDYKPLILGLIFVVIIQLFPQGLMGALERWWENRPVMKARTMDAATGGAAFSVAENIVAKGEAGGEGEPGSLR